MDLLWEAELSRVLFHSGVVATAVAAIVVVTVVVGVIAISLATAAVTIVVILKFSSRHADESGVGRDPASGCPYVGQNENG